MFKAIIRVICLVIMLSGWALAGLSLHFVRSPQRLDIIPKEHLDFHDTWSDTRNWTLADVANHPVLIERLIAAGKTDLLKHTVDPRSRDDVKTQLINALQNGDKKTPAPPAQQTQLSAGPISVTLPF